MCVLAVRVGAAEWWCVCLVVVFGKSRGTMALARHQPVLKPSTVRPVVVVRRFIVAVVRHFQTVFATIFTYSTEIQEQAGSGRNMQFQLQQLVLQSCVGIPQFR